MYAGFEIDPGIFEESSPSSPPSSSTSSSASLDSTDPLGLFTDEYVDEPTSYPPLVGSHAIMSRPQPRSSRPSPYSQSPPARSTDNESRDLGFVEDWILSDRPRSSQADRSRSRAGSSRLPAPQGNNRTNRPSASRSSNRGLTLDLSGLRGPLRAEDLASQACTSDSTTYQNGHSHLLGNRSRRQNQEIDTRQAAAVLDPGRNTQRSSSRMTQSSSNGTTSTSTRTSSSQNVGNINYGYGYTTDAALRRTGDNTAYPFCERETFFEIGMYEIEASGSNSAFEHAASVPATRPDVHNSLSPFNGVDADFTDYQDAELIRQNEQRAIVASPCSSQGSWVDVDRPEYDPFMEFQ